MNKVKCERKTGRFYERVNELKSKGLSEKEILHEINQELPEEYRLDTVEFRYAYAKAKQEQTA